MSNIWTELLKLAVVVTFGILVIILVGCATITPFNECEGDKVCEDISIRHEDNRIKRESLDFKRMQCTFPRMWDGRSRQCRTGDTWI